MKVLLVDDETEILEQAELFLERENDRINVETVNSPLKAIDLVEEKEYDAIVSDYQMPKMNGLSFLKTVRSNGDGETPFIIFTGKGREEVAMKALNIGADRYIQKGGDPKTQYGVLADAIVQEVKHRWVQEKSKEIKSLRNSIKIINKKITEKQDIKNIIEESTNTLVNTPKYKKVSIILSEKEVNIKDTAKKEPEIEACKLKEDKYAPCVREVLESGEKKIIDDITGCEECEFRLKDDDLKSIFIPISYKESHIGILGIFTEKNYGIRENEVELLKEISGELSFAVEKIKTKRELRESRSELKSLLKNSEDSIYVVDRECRYVLVNEEFLSRIGEEREDVIGKKFHKFHSKEKAREFEEKVNYVLDTGNPVKQEHEREDLGKHYLRTFSPVKDPQTGEVTKVSVFSKDITEQKKKEKGLAFERKLLQDLLDYIPDTLYFKDNENRFIRVSESHAEILGTTKENAIGKSDFDFFPEEEARELKKEDEKVMETGEPITGKLERITVSEGDERWFSITKFPRYNEKGEIIGTMGIFRDITERKKAEERANFLHCLLRHDVRNKLQASIGYMQIMKEDEIPEKHEEIVEKSLKALQNSNDLIEKVRMVRKADMKSGREESDLDEAIRKAMEKEEIDAEKRDMEIEYGEMDGKVKGGPLLVELFSNLIENSIKHSKGDKIRISSEEREEEYIVTVEDDGKGIKDELKDRIFERSYAGKESDGSGLGGYLIKMIVDRYKGDIEVKDSDLGGARFDIHLEKA